VKKIIAAAALMFLFASIAQAGKPQPSAQEFAAFRQLCERIRGRGHEMALSSFVAGVTDICAPAIRGGQAAAAEPHH